MTREGKWYIGILILIGAAAINTGNNLLYLIVATLLSLIVISGIMSEASVRGVQVTRALPGTVFKGAPARGVFRVTNGKRLVPSYALRVSEAVGPAAVAFILRLDAGRSVEARAEYIFDKRGVARLDEVIVSTRFPFGLFTKGKKEEATAEVLVLPSIDRGAAGAATGASVPSGALSGGRRGEGGGLRGLRQYTLADDARHIHWKSAARSPALFMKEFEAEQKGRVVVVFENRGEPSEAFEALVDEAAGTINHFIERGFAVGLRTLTAERPPDAGREQLVRLLRELALIEPVAGPGPGSVTVAPL